MILTRNICSICKIENFTDETYNIETKSCNECNSKLFGEELSQVTYSIQPKMSIFSKNILGVLPTKVYVLEVKSMSKNGIIPAFSLLGSKLNFPSNPKNAEIIYQLEETINTGIYRVELNIDTKIFCKLFIEKKYNINIIHPSNKFLTPGVNNV